MIKSSKRVNNDLKAKAKAHLKHAARKQCPGSNVNPSVIA